jgi:DNA recombination protein RmuC
LSPAAPAPGLSASAALAWPPSALGLLLVLCSLILVLLCLQLWLLHRARRPSTDPALLERIAQLAAGAERTERVLREELREGRSEQAGQQQRFEQQIRQALAEGQRAQAERLEGFGRGLDGAAARSDQRLEALRQSLSEDARLARAESATALKVFGEALDARLLALTQHNAERMNEVRGTLEVKLRELQTDNAAQLEQMRATVDEKLKTTLETRLGESFKLVSERLEQVHRGLGEMQNLAQGVGDLKRVLGNVKTRGTFGEVQLGALLEQILTAEQYATNIATVPGSGERVEFAVRLPGSAPDQPVWLPIDAKFPREDYERLLDAQERADPEAANLAAAALERRIREEAKRIRDKYIAPPHTTDFGLLFLPTEGLYAEVIRRPGLFEALQRDCRITLAGPTTLSALLNSLQMGFRTLAIEQRSSEVWQILGAVKAEFGKFADVLEKTQKQIETVSNSIGKAGVRTRAIERKLRSVETLEGAPLLQLDADLDDEADPSAPED